MQAYKGSLPDVHVGIAFLTFNPPRESGYPTFVDWRLGQPGGKRGIMPLSLCFFIRVRRSIGGI